ncbi:MAG: tetratricopeptide repeat protein [Alphaproteobacteria bacterium]|nr:tetratricopeptide repeat protein [Alphaproteobacteria bacterium]
MKSFTTVLVLCLIGAAGAYMVLYGQSGQGLHDRAASSQSGAALEASLQDSFVGTNFPGRYLSTRFAQRHHDWARAGAFIAPVLDNDPENAVLLKRAMVLAMGAGEAERAIALAERVKRTDEEENALSRLFLAIGDFKSGHYKEAEEAIHKMPAGGLSDFILPLLRGWAAAALGRNETGDLTGNTVHLYHAILIADFLDKTGYIEKLLRQAERAPDLGPEDMERIGDIYTHIGNTDKALALYNEVLGMRPENMALADKIARLERGEKLEIFVRIKTPEQGVAEALYDMARILAQDYSDESARVFAQMALYLDPQHTKDRFLIAHIAARNGRNAEAIKAYQAIPAEDVNYAEARRMAATLLYEQGQVEEALAVLDDLARTQEDVDALIQTGDIYRTEERFKEAIDVYNRAEEKMKGNIPPDYWHLYYVRGMSYERIGAWDKAEADLKTALKFQPDHPYLLNYLGYSWTDRGQNLEEALEMIEKAVSLRPDDGYITDSLGWVLFRLGHYEEAVPSLEQAVELMPYDPVVNDHLGDAYWQVGRRLEARFQWRRARNYSDDEALLKTIDQKLDDGLDASRADSTLHKEAHSQ